MPLSSSGALGWGAGVGLRPHTPQGKPLQLGYPFGISATTCGSRASTFHISALPTTLNVALSQVGTGNQVLGDRGQRIEPNIHSL